MSGRLLFVTVVHGVFSQYAEVMLACTNLLNVPIRNMFNASLHEHYGPIDSQRFNLVYSLCTSALFIGLLIALLTMGYLMDKLGRKETAIVLRCVLATIGCVAMVLSYWTVRFEFYVVGQFLAGIACALKTTLVIYVIECSSNDKRGWVSMVINSGGIIAVVVASVISFPSLTGNDRLWFVLPVICGLMAITQLVIAVNFPQSPKQLYIQKNKEEEARVALQFYLGQHYDIDKAIREMEAERSYETHQSISLCDILKHSTYRYLLGIVLLCAFVPTFSAFGLKVQYLYLLLTGFGLSHSQASTAMLVMSVVALPACLVSPIAIERFGRRCVFVTITAICAVEWIALGIAQVIVDTETHKTPFSWLIGTLGMTVGSIGGNLGLLIMSVIMIAEICPQNTRAAITQFTQALPIVVAMIESMMFPKLFATFGVGLYFFHAICCAVLAVVLYKQMVETATMSVDQIVQRIHQGRRHASTVASINYGAIITDCPSFVSMHHQATN